MTRCPHCQSAQRPPWWFYAILLSITLQVATTIRNDKEYRQVREIRQEGAALLDGWRAKKCVPR